MEIEPNKFFALSTSISERIGASLTAQQKKIMLIGVGALACLAACYALYWIFSKYIFKGTSTPPEKEKGNLLETQAPAKPENGSLPANATQGQEPVVDPKNESLPLTPTLNVNEPMNKKKTPDLSPVEEPVGVEGIEVLSNGIKLDGLFVDDKLVKGKITYPSTFFHQNTEILEEGEFQYNTYDLTGDKPYHLHGKGKTFVNGKLEKEGMFQKGELHGEGTVYT